MVLFERLRELDAASTEAVTAASTPMLLKTMHVNHFRYRSKRVSFVFKVERVKEGRMVAANGGKKQVGRQQCELGIEPAYSSPIVNRPGSGLVAYGRRFLSPTLLWENQVSYGTLKQAS